MAELGDDVRRVAESTGFSGAVRVHQAGRVTVDTARGMADRAHGIAATTSTRFATASATKGFTALAVMGPFIGAMVPQVIDGVDRIGKGDYYRGLEQLMPKGIGDVMKAGRFANEGVSNRKGDTTLSADALSGLDIAGQALGASPLKVSDAQAVANTTHKFEQHFKDKNGKTEKKEKRS